MVFLKSLTLAILSHNELGSLRISFGLFLFFRGVLGGPVYKPEVWPLFCLLKYIRESKGKELWKEGSANM